jgi:hypothetical protein
VPNVDPVFKNASREARVALLLFGAVFAWVIGYGAWRGYGGREVSFVCGFPDWIFWGVVVPWVVSLGAAIWFGLSFMKDDDLGPEKREGVDD